MHRNAKEGKAHSSIYPYGYTKDENGFLVINEDEAKVVRRIYRDSLNGIGTNKIAENLTNEGIPTRYNKIGKGFIQTVNKDTGKITKTKKSDIRWSGNTIRSIIKNTIYKGERKFGGNIYESPAVFDPKYWDKVNNNLSKNRNNSGKKVEHKYLLKGVLECGVCDRNMYGRSRISKKDHYYMCSSKRFKHLNCGNRSINIDFFEFWLWSYLIHQKPIKESILGNKQRNINAEINSLEAQKQQYFEEIKSINKKRSKAIDLSVNELITNQELFYNWDKYKEQYRKTTV